MKNKPWMMLICCLLPILLIFVAPSLGLNKGNALFIFIPIMLIACFMMMGKGGGGCCGGHDQKKSDTDKKDGENKTGCH
jgi:hypothetical protein